jgi:arylsulfatase A-like enzyme
LTIAALILPSCGEVAAIDPFLLDKQTPVVLIVIDTLRADHLSCYGYPLETSPALDELASRSYVFEANSTQCNATFPSLTSIFTGVYPKTHGNYLAIPVEGTVTGDRRLTCAAESFRDEGFYTAAVTSHPAWGADPDAGAILWRGWEAISHLGDPIPIEDRPLFARAEYTNARLFEQLDTYGREHSSAPLFLWAHYFDPHTDLFGNLYDPPQELRNTFFDHHIEQLGMEEFADILRPLDPSARWEWIHANTAWDLRRNLKLATGRAGYDAEILSCNQGLQELFERLARDGILDRALIVVMSDHGENMEPHSEDRAAHPFTHGRLYDGVSHTPLLIHLPGQLDERRIGSITQNIDVLPTLLELFDLPPAGQLEGKSLLPLMRGITTDLHDRVFMESSVGREKAVRSSDLKLIDGWKPDEREVYDWRSDPGEEFNLSDSFSETAPADLIGALAGFRPETKLHIRCVPMLHPYDLELQLQMPGIRIESVEGVPESTLSDERHTFTWSGKVGSEGLDIVLHPREYRANGERHWRIRHRGRTDLHRAVRLGKTPVSQTPAIPVWLLDEARVPEDPHYVITEDLLTGTTRIEVDHPGAQGIECEVRNARPRHDKDFEVERSEGFVERFPPQRWHYRGDATRVDRGLLELKSSHAEEERYYLLRVDGAWPDPAQLMINGKGVDTRLLHFVFPALPDEARLPPYLAVPPPADMKLSPGTILIWEESGASGGEIDSSSLSPELARQLNSIGYLGDSAPEGTDESPGRD